MEDLLLAVGMVEIDIFMIMMMINIITTKKDMRVEVHVIRVMMSAKEDIKDLTHLIHVLLSKAVHMVEQVVQCQKYLVPDLIKCFVIK